MNRLHKAMVPTSQVCYLPRIQSRAMFTGQNHRVAATLVERYESLKGTINFIQSQ